MGTMVGERAEDTGSLTPEELVGEAEVAGRVRAIVAALPDPDRTIIERHYFGGEQLDTAAAAVGLSKSWGSRIHARAIEKITKALRKSGDFLRTVVSFARYLRDRGVGLASRTGSDACTCDAQASLRSTWPRTKYTASIDASTGDRPPTKPNCSTIIAGDCRRVQMRRPILIRSRPAHRGCGRGGGVRSMRGKRHAWPGRGPRTRRARAPRRSER